VETTSKETRRVLNVSERKFFLVEPYQIITHISTPIHYTSTLLVLATSYFRTRQKYSTMDDQVYYIQSPMSPSSTASSVITFPCITGNSFKSELCPFPSSATRLSNNNNPTLFNRSLNIIQVYGKVWQPLFTHAIPILWQGASLAYVLYFQRLDNMEFIQRIQEIFLTVVFEWHHCHDGS